MMGTHNQEFILIDDDVIVLKFCKLLLTKTVPDAIVNTFSEPEMGLEYLRFHFSKENRVNPAVILLDINMPTMSGWDFLEQFAMLNDSIRKSIHIYILSSSVDDRDKERAFSNQYVLDYLTKPISKEAITNILKSLQSSPQGSPFMSFIPASYFPILC